MRKEVGRASILSLSMAVAFGVSTASLSCGSVAPDSELEARVAELEQQVADLTAKTQPLTQLQCTSGQVIAWNGTAWECAAAYSDQKAVAAVASADAYVTKTGDSTITGNLTVTGTTTSQDMTVSSSRLTFGLTTMIYSRATIARSGNVIEYSEPGMAAPETLDLGAGTAPAGGGSTAHIAYLPGGTGDARLLFNISGLGSLHCTLLHADDDTVAYDLAFASDTGNGYLAQWGNTTKRTFILSRKGTPTYVIDPSRTYNIACF